MNIDPAAPGHGWLYRRPVIAGISELGIFDGSRGLATHFHDELQITFVFAGQRAFRIGGDVIVLSAGQCAAIPAGVAHQSLAGSADLSSFNAYAPAGAYAFDAMTNEIEALFKSARCLPLPDLPLPDLPLPDLPLQDLASVIQSHRLNNTVTQTGRPGPIHFDSEESVGALAARLGQSREGFSRSFAARHGMPPHAFKLARRLNRARELLKAGEPVAAAAAGTGFADQSHLGRHFRRAFGITPGKYRLG